MPLGSVGGGWSCFWEILLFLKQRAKAGLVPWQISVPSATEKRPVAQYKASCQGFISVLVTLWTQTRSFEKQLLGICLSTCSSCVPLGLCLYRICIGMFVFLPSAPRPTPTPESSSSEQSCFPQHAQRLVWYLVLGNISQ